MKNKMGLMAAFAALCFLLSTGPVLAGTYRIKWGAVSPRIGSFAYLTTMARTVNKELKGDVAISPMETGGFLDNILRPTTWPPTPATRGSPILKTRRTIRFEACGADTSHRCFRWPSPTATSTASTS